MDGLTIIIFIIGVLIGILIANISMSIVVPHAGNLYLDKSAKQAFIGFTNLDLDKLHNNARTTLTVKEIDISKHSATKTEPLVK